MMLHKPIFSTGRPASIIWRRRQALVFPIPDHVPRIAAPPSPISASLQSPPPVPTKATNGAGSWGAPAATSAPSSASRGTYGSSSGGGGGGGDSDRMAAIEAKLDKIMRHLGIS